MHTIVLICVYKGVLDFLKKTRNQIQLHNKINEFLQKGNNIRIIFCFTYKIIYHKIILEFH